MKGRWAVAVMAGVVAVTGWQVRRGWCGDPGDLFPSVGYEQALETPSRPVRPSSDGGGASSAEAVPAAEPAPEVAPAGAGHAGGTVHTPPAGSGTSVAATRAGSAPKAVEGAGAGHAGKGAGPKSTAPFWSPYGARLLVPLLMPEGKATFNATYKEILTGATRSNEARVAAAEALDAAAAPGNAMDGNLRRYVLQQALTLAVKGKAPVETREKLAGEFLPLVEWDHTLPATQAKAGALEALAMSGTADSPASSKLLDFTAQAYGDLALAQAQVGYPAQAQASLKKANAWLARMAPIDGARLVQFSQVQYWLTREQTAKLLAPKLKQALADTPEDAGTNTQLAALHLSLFADVTTGAACGAKSDKAEFKALAKVVAGLEGGVEAVDPGTPAGLAASLDLCKALLGVAGVCADPFDRFAIATYVKTQAEELADKGKVQAGTEAWTRLQSVESGARAIIAANPPPMVALDPTATTGTTSGGTTGTTTGRRPPRHTTTP